ncbi:glycosyltransferase [Burkholderia gladioli]|uniref:glycosyltransferase n=2 Tax=Burkholderia gladioli TaxID=28095 RepID=UPI000CDAB85E|nr:glycosyltransferase [Burkholderia gladioli]MBA1360450.1 glycosyltransferase [Burkholderia gladioli]NRF83380.1 glycosyltransferase [Burkholderia gladioli]POS05047.1 glycosyl transferase [Burkholderia gladioli]
MTAAQSPMRAISISVSVVLYHPDETRLRATLTSLGAAVRRLRERRGPARAHLVLVDNGGMPVLDSLLDSLHADDLSWECLTGHGNVGYGRGHNLAIERAVSNWHLILNPDIDLDADVFVAALDFLDAHSDVGLLSPYIADEHGHMQYLCRRYPALIDLLVRGFLPISLRQPFARRLARYEMQDCITATEAVLDPPIVSGCFMLYRTPILQQLGGFDRRYFLYFEDYDLSLRTPQQARVAYVPSMRVIHHGGGAARKGFVHIRMFAASAFKFYRRFGWRWW